MARHQAQPYASAAASNHFRVAPQHPQMGRGMQQRGANANTIVSKTINNQPLIPNHQAVINGGAVLRQAPNGHRQSGF